MIRLNIKNIRGGVMGKVRTAGNTGIKKNVKRAKNIKHRNRRITQIFADFQFNSIENPM